MRVLSLFSGIGGIDLGLERAGMTIAGQCENDEFCQKILKKHWPDVPRFGDIRNLSVDDIRRACGHVDIVAGGFPCQDISVAGKGKGLSGARSGLYWEMWRIIDQLRPAWLLLENVCALRTRGGDEVLSSLEKLGYACWPIVVGAWAVGAPHQRNRVWIVSNAATMGRGSGNRESGNEEGAQFGRLEFVISNQVLPNANGDALRIKSGRIDGTDGEEAVFVGEILEHPDGELKRSVGVETGGCLVEAIEISAQSKSASELANGERIGLEKRHTELQEPRDSKDAGVTGASENVRPPSIQTHRWPAPPGQEQFDYEPPRVIKTQSGLGRGFIRLPRRMDKLRLKALGNSVVPQVVQVIGEWILKTNKELY